MDVRGESLLHRHSEHVGELLRRAADARWNSEGTREPLHPFAALLSQGVQQVNDSQLESQQKIEQLLSGEDVQQAEVFTSIQKADMSFRLLVQIRNKLLQAFEELNAIRV